MRIPNVTSLPCLSGLSFAEDVHLPVDDIHLLSAGLLSLHSQNQEPLGSTSVETTDACTPSLEEPADLREVCTNSQAADKSATNSWAIVYCRDGVWSATNNGGEKFRVKKVSYGKHFALGEMFAATLMRMTGLPAPKVCLVKNTANIFPPPEGTCLSVDGSLHVASRMIDGYQDLGTFLLTQGNSCLAKASDHDRYNAMCIEYSAATVAEQQLLDDNPALAKKLKQKPGPLRNELPETEQHALDALRALKRQKLRALTTMNNLLPAEFQYATELSLVAANYLRHWDLLNQDLANTGPVLHKTTDGKWELKGNAIVDYGNALMLGFRGETKPQSEAIARERARSDDPWPPHSPALGPRDLQITPVLSSANGLSSAPRTGPYAHLKGVESLVKAETEEYINYAGKRHNDSSSPGLEAAVEFAYRLTLWPSDAIDRLVHRYWLIGKSADFQEESVDYPKAESFIEQINAQTQITINRFTPIQIRRWAAKHPDRAALARLQVTQALEELFQAAPKSQAQQVLEERWQAQDMSRAQAQQVSEELRQAQTMSLVQAQQVSEALHQERTRSLAQAQHVLETLRMSQARAKEGAETLFTSIAKNGSSAEATLPGHLQSPSLLLDKERPVGTDNPALAAMIHATGGSTQVVFFA